MSRYRIPVKEHEKLAAAFNPICFEKKIKPQVKELLTNYGKIDLIWFDTPLIISKEQRLELYDMVKKYQPECLVNSRIGNGVGDYRSCNRNFARGWKRLK